MQKNFLKEVVGSVVGKQAEDIVDLLDSDKYINEFIIAKRLDITINQTRNILYKLSDSGLVSSTRKKDKKKGWYTYFWKIEVLKSLEFLKGVFEKRIEQMNNQVKSRETKQFYICDRCSIEFTEEHALANNFTCNECGEVFTLKDNAKMLRELNKSLDKQKKELVLINEEIRKEQDKLEKIRAKDRRKFEREKEKERLTKKKVREKEKKIAEKGRVKEKIKKKVSKKKPLKIQKSRRFLSLKLQKKHKKFQEKKSHKKKVKKRR